MKYLKFKQMVIALRIKSDLKDKIVLLLHDFQSTLTV